MATLTELKPRTFETEHFPCVELLGGCYTISEEGLLNRRDRDIYRAQLSITAIINLYRDYLELGAEYGREEIVQNLTLAMQVQDKLRMLQVAHTLSLAKDEVSNYIRDVLIGYGQIIESTRALLTGIDPEVAECFDLLAGCRA